MLKETGEQNRDKVLGTWIKTRKKCNLKNGRPKKAL